MTLAGAIAGFQTFASVMAVDDTCYYGIEAVDGDNVPTGEWETGLGTYSGVNTLTRTHVHESSNGDAAVNFSAGTKRVFIGLTAAEAGALAGGGFASPTVRSSSISSSSAGSYNVSWPAGTVAGDLVIIAIGGGFFAPVPTGWTQFYAQRGTNAQINCFGKVMTAADITAGSVTVTMEGTFNSCVMAVTIIGTTFGLFNGAGVFQSGSSTTSFALTNALARENDLVLNFAYTRAAANVTMADSNEIQTVNATNASGAIGQFTGDLNQLGMQDIVSVSGANSGVAAVSVALRGAEGWSPIGNQFTDINFSAFGLTLIDDADAAVALATLGITMSSVSAANPGKMKLTVGGNKIMLQWGTGSIGANSSDTVTFPEAFNSWAWFMANGGDTGTSSEGDVHNTSTTTSAGSIVMTGGATANYSWFAIGDWA